MTALFGLSLFGIITVGVASGLAVFQYIVLPLGEFLGKLKALTNK